MNATTFVYRARQLGTFLRLFVTPGSYPELHLTELLASARFAGIPRIDLSEATSRLERQAGSPLERVVLHPRLRGAGSGSAGEMAALAALVAARRPSQVLEFGTYDGCSTWHFWANSGGQCRITTIDLPSGAKVEGSTDDPLQGVKARPYLPRDPRVRLVEADSRQWTPDVSGVDLCFIDAGHSYNCVRSDTEKALSVMNKGGVVVWHDATWRWDSYEVNRYLKELRGGGSDVRLLYLGSMDFCSIAVLFT